MSYHIYCENVWGFQLLLSTHLLLHRGGIQLLLSTPAMRGFGRWGPVTGMTKNEIGPHLMEQEIVDTICVVNRSSPTS